MALPIPDAAPVTTATLLSYRPTSGSPLSDSVTPLQPPADALAGHGPPPARPGPRGGGTGPRPAVVDEQGPQRRAHGQLVDLGGGDVAVEDEQHGAGGAPGSDAAEPVRPVGDDGRDVGQGLDVV